MKITMYELLGMIKDGKELPKKIKVLDTIYEFDDHYGDYFNKSLDRYLFVYMASEEEWKIAYFLNAQVEILEEEKKIPERVLNAKVFDVPKLNNMELSNIALTNKQDIKLIKDTLNEVLDYLKSKGEE